MKKTFLLEFDPVTQTLAIVENDFTTFEAFGVLEAAKKMIAASWLQPDDEEGERP